LVSLGDFRRGKDKTGTYFRKLEDNTMAEDKVSREVIFKTIVEEAAGLYNLIMTLDTAVFGATLIFLEKIAPTPTKLSIVFLAFGWASLILSLVFCLWVRWNNLESGRHALEGDFKEAYKIDEPNRCWTKWAICLIVAGIAFIAIFGLLNIIFKIPS
jgi:hypothetical protein